MKSRPRLGALSLIAAAPILLVADRIRSDHSGKTARQLAEVAAQRTPELASAALFLVGGVLLVLACYGLAGAVEGRGRRLVGVGTALLGVGGLWIGVGRAMYGFLLYVAASPTLDHAAATAVLDRITSSGAFAIFLPLLLALIIGPVVLGLGLWRAGIAPIVVPAIWLVGAIAFQALEGSKPAEAVTFGAMMLALAMLGASILIRGAETRRRSGVVAPAALMLLVAALLALAGAAASGSAAASSRDFTLVGNPKSETSIMRGTAKPQPGSRFLEYGTLNGAKRGTYAIEGVLATPVAIGVELTTASFTLGDGTLIAVGSHGSTDRFILPIIGGTGTFLGAHGTVTIAPADRHAERLTFHIA